ncbi:hypothetical protein, partial [Hungatella hathewayi]|uniref:hypothetical protein n=1 Tax=Hungatella hathewayi TaxID=154046 RepID=UPI0035632E05
AFGYILPTTGRIPDLHRLETCAAGRTKKGIQRNSLYAPSSYLKDYLPLLRFPSLIQSVNALRPVRENAQPESCLVGGVCHLSRVSSKSGPFA